MSYNGSGTFQINTSGQPVVAGTVISSTAFNALTADLATGLSTAITKDGQTTATARIPFAQGISSTLTTDSSSVSTGSIITAGGAGIAKALFVGTTANVAGAVTLQSTLGVTGVATFSAAPIYSSLTASSAVATDASKGLVSVTNTGTGNNVLATSPTITTPTINQLSSASATALILQSANTTAITVDTSQNTTLAGTLTTSSRGIAKASMPAGTVLQVVQGLTTTSTTISAGPTDTTLTATITPTSATSTILIVVNQFVYLTGGGGDSGFQLFILKNGSIVYNNTSNSLYIASSLGSPETITNYPITYLDSPATTSALTYKTQATATSGGTPTFQQGSNQSTITLMEISA